MSEGPTHGQLILKRLSPTNKTQSSDQPRSFRNRTEKRPALPQQHGGAARQQAGRLTKRVDMRLSRKRKPLRSICYVCDRSPSRARGSQDLATVGRSRERHEVHALGKVVPGAADELDAQPRLAGAARTRQRQQPVVLEKIPSMGEFLVAPDEARPWSRKPARRIPAGACRRV
jgi:hypothetical protein